MNIKKALVERDSSIENDVKEQKSLVTTSFSSKEDARQEINTGLKSARTYATTVIAERNTTTKIDKSQLPMCREFCNKLFDSQGDVESQRAIMNQYAAQLSACGISATGVAQQANLASGGSLLGSLGVGGSGTLGSTTQATTETGKNLEKGMQYITVAEKALNQYNLCAGSFLFNRGKKILSSYNRGSLDADENILHSNLEKKIQALLPSYQEKINQMDWDAQAISQEIKQIKDKDELLKTAQDNLMKHYNCLSGDQACETNLSCSGDNSVEKLLEKTKNISYSSPNCHHLPFSEPKTYSYTILAILKAIDKLDTKNATDFKENTNNQTCINNIKKYLDTLNIFYNDQTFSEYFKDK